MAQKPLPSADVLRQLLDYDHRTGDLVWKHRDASAFTSTPTHSAEALAKQFNTSWAGKRALGALDSVGYRSGRLLSSQVRAHRVIWKMVYGYEPKLIDHINQDKTDNRLCNLREVDKAMNSLNRKKKRISWDKSRNKWQVYCRFKGQTKNRRCKTFCEAVRVSKEFYEQTMAEAASNYNRPTPLVYDSDEALSVHLWGSHEP